MPRWRMVGVAVLAGAPFTGCHDPTLRDLEPFLLVEKGPYQSLYRRDGKIERLLYDRNGDRVADAIILYGLDGTTVRQAEIDTDLDKVIDRWEHFDRGVLVRLGYSRRTPGVADHWDVVARGGALIGREYDDDGDGRVDRSEALIDGR